MLEEIDSIIDEPLKFKEKLGIGEDAYTSLRLKKAAAEAWDALSAAGTAVTVAQSSVIASTFFAPSGFLGLLGIGTAATPIGWVVAAAVISGGAWMSISRYIKNNSGDRVSVIPKFINTPMDVLALGLFNLMAPLSLKIADADGCIEDCERSLICDYFVKEWGYNKAFVENGIPLIEKDISDSKIKDLALNMAEFQKTNPDCHYKNMTKEIVSFLNDIMASDGKIDEREEMAIERIENIFKDTGKINLKEKAATSIKEGSSFIGNIFKKAAPKGNHN